MNLKLVAKTLSRILSLEAFFMLLPLIVAFVYKEDEKNIISFVVVIIALTIIGALSFIIKTDNISFNVKDGFAIVVLSWIMMSVFGSLPFVISGEIPLFVDALFETASGFTTTGATIIPEVESLSHSMLFWRSFTHFIGGMGILVFALAVLPKAKGSVNVMRAEVPGPVFGKLVAKLDITAQILYMIYVVMTVVLIAVLMMAGMNFFDAMIHAFGTAGTGGFSNKADSIGCFNNPAIEYIITFGMLAFGVNFNLYYLVLIGRGKYAVKSEELRAYLILWGLASLLISLHNFNIRGFVLHKHIRDVLFTTASVMTTTGYATYDYTKWDMFSQYIILLLMFTGACAGSTAGGFKISRLITLTKAGINSLRRAISPKRVLVISDEGKVVAPEMIKEGLAYLFLYISVFFVALGIILLDCNDFSTAFSSVATTLNNVGPGLGLVGPSGNFAFYSPLSKVTLGLVMIVGRLEIIPVLVLFMPATWKRR